MAGIRPFALGFLCAFVLYGTGFAQKRTFHCRKTDQVLSFIQQNHYSPPPIDDRFNETVNRTFINTLDPLGLFFSRDDVKILLERFPDLADLDCDDNKNFMEHIVDHYRICLLDSELMMETVFSSSLDFNRMDTLVLPERGETSYPEDLAGILANWEKYLKFQVLRYYFSTYRSGDTAFVKDESNFHLHQDSLWADILQREYCKINHLLDYPGGFDAYIFGIYLNTLTANFDPHTNYFSMSDKELFESSISRNKISFGVDLDQNDEGEIVISRLIPGGPAWRSGEINAGDVLLSIRFPEMEIIDLVCSNLAEIQDLIYNSRADHIEVTVRSGLGQVKTVELKMESLAAAENSTYSFVLDGDHKIGYITLPGFYTEPDQNDPLGCASDLVKEIRRLKSDGVEGLILDLRNNGGGSIVEAVDLAGIFIDSGPLCIYRRPGDKTALIKDLKKGTVYDGPLLLMINGYSASAAEILAGILRDYNRAVIFGTPSFGKASGQVIAPLTEPGQANSGLYLYNEDPSDYLKITTTRYYRLDGSSHQANGIIPDIQMPVHAGYAKIKESEFPSFLPNDTVRKPVTFEPFAPLPLDSLRSRSCDRVSKNDNFNAFKALNDSIRPLYTGRLSIPLDFDSFRSEYLRNRGFFNRIDSLEAIPDVHYTIRNNTHDMTMLKSDAYKSEIHDEIIENLKGDFYLEEAYSVTGDLIGLPTNKKKKAQ